MPLAPVFLVRQRFPRRAIADIADTVQQQLTAARLDAGLAPQASVAIGVGSRGIANLAAIVAAAVAWWKQRGFAPFIFPAMGSHGAATAAGQTAVLAKYGVTAEAMGCQVRSSLAVKDLGATPEGIEVVLDRTAARAAGIMLISRVKWHTDFEGSLESGLFKMMAIGLGKFAGAQRYHNYAYRMGLEAVIRSVGRHVLARARILGGLAILEDANHDTAQLAAVRPEEMEHREEELLRLVKSWMPRLPLDAVDIVMVNEIGKNWSGSGLDTKTINRGVRGEYNPWPHAPRIERIYVRDLSPLSYGNAIGLGLADCVHTRLVRKMKKQPTYVNCITSTPLACARIPMHFPSDRQCLEAVARTVGKLDPATVTLAWIRNTQDLTVLACSGSLRPILERREGLELLPDGAMLPFDASGDLPDLLS
jgi:hypothetical protein